MSEWNLQTRQLICRPRVVLEFLEFSNNNLLIDIGPLLGILEVGLHLPELGKVQGGDLLGLLYLPLVALHLVGRVALY